MGRELVEKAASGSGQKLLTETSVIKRARSALLRLVDAPHRKPVAWPTIPVGYVQVEGTMARNGFRETGFYSAGTPLPCGASLTFVANTDVPKPFKIYWQIVNTGDAAAKAKNCGGIRRGHCDDRSSDQKRNGGLHRVSYHRVLCSQRWLLRR